MKTQARSAENSIFHWGLVLAGSVALIIGQLAPNALNHELSNSFLIALILVIGLPHGALDAWLFRLASDTRNTFDYIAFLVMYILCTGIVLCLWLISPGLGLALFLCYSAWHFSADWTDLDQVAFSLVMGIAVVSLPALFHVQEVSHLFQIIAGERGPFIADWLAGTAAGVVSFLVLCSIAFFNRLRHRSVQMLLLILLAWQTPPMVYFVVYFCFAHSLRHYSEVLKLSDSQQRRTLGLNAVGFTLLAVTLGVVIAICFPSDVQMEDQVLRAVFVGLAALTAPHILIVPLSKRAIQSKQGYI